MIIPIFIPKTPDPKNKMESDLQLIGMVLPFILMMAFGVYILSDKEKSNHSASPYKESNSNPFNANGYGATWPTNRQPQAFGFPAENK